MLLIFLVMLGDTAGLARPQQGGSAAAAEFIETGHAVHSGSPRESLVEECVEMGSGANHFGPIAKDMYDDSASQGANIRMLLQRDGQNVHRNQLGKDQSPNEQARVDLLMMVGSSRPMDSGVDALIAQNFGMINVGNTCYAIAVLRFLAGCPAFVSQLLQDFATRSSLERPVLCAFCDIMTALYSDQCAPVSSELVHALIRRVQDASPESHLTIGNHCDASEFLVCLLNALDEESLLRSRPFLYFFGFVTSNAQ
jgi:hypothetical protein